jgi:hypothetical protein
VDVFDLRLWLAPPVRQTQSTVGRKFCALLWRMSPSACSNIEALRKRYPVGLFSRLDAARSGVGY